MVADARAEDVDSFEVNPLAMAVFNNFLSFPAQPPTTHHRFTCFEEVLFEQGYDSEQEQVYYGPLWLNNDPSKFEEAAIQTGPPCPSAAATAAAP